MNIKEYMQNHVLVLDGGMGTLLQAAGLAPGELPERWNLTHPEVIRRIHKNYFDAGSHVVNTNTFGANPLHFAPDELDDIIRAAVENAKVARDASIGTQEKFISLDIGPTGRLLKPYGDFDFEDAVAAFAEVVRLGVKYGVDLVTIETMNDSYETKAAVLAVKENLPEGCDLPVFVTNAYGADGKLMTGATPEAMVAMLEAMHADAIGANCSLGPRQLMPVVERLLACASTPVILKPNAGLPTNCDDRTVYDVLPDEFVADVYELAEKGVRIVGGCCGTSPDYIRPLASAVRDMTPLPVTEKRLTCVSSYTHAVTFDRDPILIGERINPTGKKRFKQALVEHDMDYILREGLSQAEAGVHILDVNVGLPDIDEPAMLRESVCELQAIIDLPLQIDTSDPVAMETALRRYNGKAMVNSVNGKAESMHAIFPLVKKYGGLVVALTLDENGIPATAEGRYAIAERILGTAAAYGIDKKDIIFDTLAMTISAEPKAAIETVRALKMIREGLGCHTSLGVSNVSFGLPLRDGVNSTFFALALENGLSAAIMNPYSGDMVKTYHAYRALKALDENCADYIAFAADYANHTPVPIASTGALVSAARTQTAGGEQFSLHRAVIKGLREQATILTDELLTVSAPMDIVQSHVIPALDEVGKGFEAGTVYLPQLLMSAEAAQCAFARIKAAMSATHEKSGEGKMTVVLATVKGDIHDIGKNIVKLLLENYGFHVIDLGHDVPLETVLDAVLKTRAPLCGLSALMTTTVPAMEATIAIIHKEAPFCRVMVGGAVLNPEYAARIGADAYGKDAMESVRYAEKVYSELS